MGASVFDGAPWVLAAVFAAAGVLHFVAPGPYEQIVPRWLPAPRALVYLSGLAELCGGLGVAYGPTRQAAGWGLMLLLLAVFPANVQMLSAARAGGAASWWQAALWLRLPLQPLLMWWVWRAAVRGE